MSEFKVETAALKAAMDKISEKIRKGTKATFRGWALAVMGQFKAGMRSRFHAHGTGFRNSFAVRFAGKSEQEIEAHFASTHKGARLQEYGSAGLPGGVVSPKKKKWLAIPMPGSPAVQPSGGPRYATSLYDTAPKWARLRFSRGKKAGVAWLLGKASTAKSAPIVAWYQLRKQVRIPPRLKMREHIRNAIANLKAQMAQEINRG